MFKIVLATSNPHKAEEINNINSDKDIFFESVKGKFEPDENGTDFFQNALIKAKESAKISGNCSLADDSGLCVDILDGRPGIHSARYASAQDEKIKKLLSELKDVPKEKRCAHFTCAMVLVDKNGNILFSEEGRIDGYIDFEPKGENGFGYDPIFFVPEYNKTIAELPEDIKNKISHRAKALNKIINDIKKTKSEENR